MTDRKEFLALFSHEVRARLGLIRNYAEILLDKPPKDAGQQHEFLTIIRDESDHLVGLLSELVTVERIALGIVSWKIDRLSPAVPLNRSILECDEEATRKGIAVDAHIETDLPPLAIDESAFGAVFTHLLRNAIRFSPRGRPVRVKASVVAPDGQHEAGTVRIEFQDAGIGISRTEHENIFRTFYRAASPVDGSPDGSGMGLAFAQAVVRAFGGRIDVESTEGRGSRFTVSLPITSALTAGPAE